MFLWDVGGRKIPPGSVASRFACYTMYLSYIACFINNTPDDEERAELVKHLNFTMSSLVGDMQRAGAPKHLVSEMDKLNRKFMELLRDRVLDTHVAARKLAPPFREMF